MGTVARNNVIGVFVPACQGGQGVIEPEMAFGFLAAMTPQAGGFEDRPDVTVKINFYTRWRRQSDRVGFRSREREGKAE
jgi:hypothetical protein